ncbi:polysaccharide biosynthesis/export family protein [Biformimicrobium ophioploci]|uniref:Exopolysaccharide export protein VpsN n=1 Tax=Biformimicrobium ophioploci TaxID=3036711 RepID=A0ABQ6M0E0_9GAMM|nr:polysaccharide biosynthesis/export family protein [Microbulbifer sp. NKW57]GMG87740.1 exopolysaccharide export protein VpsN [Microbulbifer sp. NKW57]
MIQIAATSRFIVRMLFSIIFVATLTLPFPTGSHAQGAISDYRLGSGDRIQIRVYGEEDLSLEALISDSGTFVYPFLGEVLVNGLTLSQLETVIRTGLKGDYLINPDVLVSIVEYRPFFIQGEVNAPGGYPFQPGLTINKAAAVANGFTERASEKKIFVVRGDDPQQNRVKAKLTTMIRPGDIITVEQGFF